MNKSFVWILAASAGALVACGYGTFDKVPKDHMNDGGILQGDAGTGAQNPPDDPPINTGAGGADDAPCGPGISIRSLTGTGGTASIQPDPCVENEGGAGGEPPSSGGNPPSEDGGMGGTEDVPPPGTGGTGGTCPNGSGGQNDGIFIRSGCVPSSGGTSGSGGSAGSLAGSGGATTGTAGTGGTSEAGAGGSLAGSGGHAGSESGSGGTGGTHDVPPPDPDPQKIKFLIFGVHPDSVTNLIFGAPGNRTVVCYRANYRPDPMGLQVGLFATTDQIACWANTTDRAVDKVFDITVNGDSVANGYVEGARVYLFDYGNNFAPIAQYGGAGNLTFPETLILEQISGSIYWQFRLPAR